MSHTLRFGVIQVAMLVGLAVICLPGYAAPTQRAALEPAPGDGGELSSQRMQALDMLIGQWSLTSTERTPDGEALQARGTRTCRWALNGTAIRCDDRFDLFGSVDGAARAVSVADSLFYLSFNGRTGLYEYTYYSPELPEIHTVPATYDASLRTLTGSAWISDEFGEPRLAMNESRLLGSDRIEETVSVHVPGEAARLELLEISLVRRADRPAPIIHF